MKRINTVIFIVLTLAGLWFGRNYYKNNMRRVIGIQRTQVADISRSLRSGEKGAEKKAMALLLVYGVVHSLGPGHGKSIISSVFLAGEGGVKKVLLLGGLISYLQGFTAYLTVRAFNFLGRNLLPVAAQQTEDNVRYLTAIFILGIGLYLLYRKAVKRGCECAKEERSSLWMALLLGVTPCYGTVNVLLFLGLMGMEEYQLMGTLAIGTGMFITVGGTGILAKTFKWGSRRIGEGCYEILEYAGPGVMVLYSLNFLGGKVSNLL
ncbi:nickel/cobalt efflux system [Propionigenium maris DSM 9537]|uniref:Nickel/cobalt efflux system n=1 Tax=Propionigenium maris DSM 9537 TaxID=1123000 RepID=A0A9W6GJS9_9FUSO|nr:hypothetical protein [Propionigenium maris]GLI56453.1 nickel/cobalt efflux system [Propionigenium maris DSM 9537]